MFSPPAQNCITAESYPFLSPSWCHQRWFPYGRHPHRSWRNRSGTSSTSGLQTHTGNDFSFQRRKMIIMKMDTKMQKERNTEVMIDIKGNSILLLLFTDKSFRQDYLYSQRNEPNVCLQTGRVDSQCGRAYSARCGTGRPPVRRYTSLPARGSMFRPGKCTRTGRWTGVLTSGCPPRCRYTSGYDRQTCRSCASPSPCTSAGRAGNRKQEAGETGSVRHQKED